MARPRLSDEERVTTAVRLPASLHEALVRLATELDVSVNYLLTKAARHVVNQLADRDLALRTTLGQD